jgi:hypothetical protein
LEFDLAFNVNFEFTYSCRAKYEPTVKIGAVSAKVIWLCRWTDHKSQNYYTNYYQRPTCKTTSKPFSHKGKAFSYGSLFVPVQNQGDDIWRNTQYLNNIIKYSCDMAVETGFTDGINLSNPNFETLETQKWPW